MFIGSILCYLLFRSLFLDNYLYDFSISLLGEYFGHQYLSWSRYFISDYVVGTLVCINFLGFAFIQSHWTTVLFKLESGIRLIASLTFTLYLFHFPLMSFISVVCDDNRVIIGVTLMITGILGIKIERSKRYYKE